MKPLICQRCGAPINRSKMTCEYCGTQYEFKGANTTLKYDPRISILRVEHEIDKRDILYHGQYLIEQSIKELAYQIAENLIPYMDIQQDDNPLNNSVILKAQVRVIKPNEKII